ncbi:Crp/Fnr family transcriptional regulator [Parasulfuritortus cantonensis]|uniref:Crp/Fnr family transcriptional regulator n=1 Tax=Parasulfuritortus cantonensis TaxID=2528202 RepID=A0A4R1BHE2_9PROT|nr:Crp/Fnr family transcriptional regulator [Parasulfuritortus cantonensis]TCJ16518.1 Crp/Fnr family transcriptional regulator [Parasulfuritortus cantonensis]
MIHETRHPIPEILARQPMFRNLDPAELDAIASGTREYRVRRNEVLFQKGDPAAGMHIVIAGQVKLSIGSSQGSEKVIHMAGPGSTFGEAVAFLDRPYPVSAVATQDSIVMLIGKPTLERVLVESPAFSRKMLASLSSRLHELIDDMESCTLRTSMQRVICFLGQQAPASQDGAFSVHLNSSKQTVASRLNLAPETLSRVLGQLAEAGLIRVDGRTITVLSRTDLERFQA